MPESFSMGAAAGPGGSLRTSHGPEDVDAIRCRRRHGDPFPLPAPCHQVQGQACDTRQGWIVDALNHLVSHAEFNAPRPQRRHAQDLTSVQEVSRAHVQQCLDEAGPQPPGMTPDTAFKDMMATKSLYSDVPSNLADYDPEKLKVLKSRFKPQPLGKFLPTHVNGS